MASLRIVWAAIFSLGSKEKGLRRCLQGYLFSLVAVTLGSVLTLLLLLGVFSRAERELGMLLDEQLISYEKMISTHYRNVSSQGIALARQLTGQIEKNLAKSHMQFNNVSDQAGLIGLLEEKTFPLLRQALLMTGCTGAFMILETTVNTRIAKAEHSRSGLYLKFANVNLSAPSSSAVLLLRGMPDIAYKNDISFHAQWELEFDTRGALFYQQLLAWAKPDLASCYYYTPASSISGVMERSMRVMVPLVGSSGQVYGTCGFEISDLYFRLTHAQYNPDLQNLIGLLVPKIGSQLIMSHALESGSHSGYFANLGIAPLEVTVGKYYNTYRGERGHFVGLEKPIILSPLHLSHDEGDGFVLAVLISEKELEKRRQQSNRASALYSGIFTGLFLVLALLLNRLCVRPVVSRFQNMG